MIRLEDVARMNPWWGAGLRFASVDKDLVKLSSSVFRFERRVPELKPGNIYIIKGPRRVGKTALLKTLILKLLTNGVDRLGIFYYSLDSIKSSEELRNMLNSFFDKPGFGMRYIMLDEVQNVEGWELILQALANEGMLKDVATIVTGSLAHVLRQELMPGRGTEGNTYVMHALTFRDFCTGMLKNSQSANVLSNVLSGGLDVSSFGRTLENGISIEGDIGSVYAKLEALAPYAVALKRLFEIYLRTGGYPASINSYFLELPGKPALSIDQAVYEEIYLYAKNDAATIVGSGRGGSPAFAEGVLKSMLDHVGTEISYMKLSRQASMNTKTFIEYSQRLKESYVFLTLQGIKKGFIPMRSQKTYFSDPLLNYSVGSAITGEEANRYTETILNSDRIGAVIEEIIASHLSYAKENEPMRKYDTYLNFVKAKHEIDFAYKRNDGSYMGIEAKYQNAVSAKNDLYKVNGIDEYMLVSKDTLEKAPDCVVVPAYLFLAALKKSSKDL